MFFMGEWGVQGDSICSLNKPMGFVFTLCLHPTFLANMQGLHVFKQHFFRCFRGFFLPFSYHVFKTKAVILMVYF